MPSFGAISLNILLTAVILVVGWWFSGYLGTLVKKFFKHSTKIDRTLLPIVDTIAVWSIRTIVILAVLARIGVQTASLVAVIGASALAVGLALQGTLQNFAAGIMLLILRPIRADEYISVEGKGMGTVDEIGIFLTRIIKDDGVHLLLPNSLVWGNPIVNYSRNQTRRMDMQLAVRYGENVEQAMSILKKLVEENENVLAEPAPQVMVTEFRESTVTVNVWAWIGVDKYWGTRYDLYQQAPEALRAAGLSSPIPLREIRQVEENSNKEAK